MHASLKKVCTTCLTVGLLGLTAPLFAQSVIQENEAPILLKSGLNQLLNESYEFTLNSRLKKLPASTQTQITPKKLPSETASETEALIGNILHTYINIVGNADFSARGAFHHKKKLFSSHLTMRSKSDNLESYLNIPVFLDYSNYKAVLGVTEFNSLIFANTDIPATKYQNKYVQLTLPAYLIEEARTKDIEKKVLDGTAKVLTKTIDGFDKDKIVALPLTAQDKQYSAQHKIRVTASQMDWQRAMYIAIHTVMLDATEEKKTTEDRVDEMGIETDIDAATQVLTEEEIDRLLNEQFSMLDLLMGEEHPEKLAKLKEFFHQPVQTDFLLDQKQRVVRIESPTQVFPTQLIMPFISGAVPDLGSDVNVSIKYLGSPKLPFNPKKRDIVEYPIPEQSVSAVEAEETETVTDENNEDYRDENAESAESAATFEAAEE